MLKVLMSLLFSAFLLTATSFAQAPAVAPASAVAAPESAKPVHREHRTHNTEIHKVMHKLREAKQDLGRAQRDFGGHRAKAIAAINQAIEELQAALDYAATK